MRVRIALPALLLISGTAAAQSPVADAFRWEAGRAGKNLTAAAEAMPADKYGYKPTPAQMSFGDIVAHLAGGNDILCGAIGGTKAPQRTAVPVSAGKDALVARLKETFKFCDEALAKLDDSQLSEKVSFFGSNGSRALAMMIAADDWGDHYSQSAIYLRVNGQLPPTAKPAAKP